VQVTLGMATDKLEVVRERDIAFDDSCSLHCCGLVRFDGVLGEHHACSPVTDGKVRSTKRGHGIRARCWKKQGEQVRKIIYIRCDARSSSSSRSCRAESRSEDNILTEFFLQVGWLHLVDEVVRSASEANDLARLSKDYGCYCPQGSHGDGGKEHSVNKRCIEIMETS